MHAVTRMSCRAPNVKRIAARCPLFGDISYPCARSAARDGGVRVADRDVRPGEGVSRSLRAGLQAAPGGGHGLGPDLHHCVHAL